jgi:hypothetical protein
VRGTLAARRQERWQAHFGSNDLDEPTEVVFYCPRCAEREFDDD